MAVEYLRSLIKNFEKLREDRIDKIFIEAKKKAEMLGIVNEFQISRIHKKKKMDDELAEDEITTLSEKQKFNILIKSAMDNILSRLRDRFGLMENIVSKYSFLDNKILF